MERIELVSHFFPEQILIYMRVPGADNYLDHSLVDITHYEIMDG